jgi:hypothetical protein
VALTMTLVPIVLLFLGFPIFVDSAGDRRHRDHPLLLDPAHRAAPGDVRVARQRRPAGGPILYFRR